MAENSQLQIVSKPTTAQLNRFATPLDVKNLAAEYGTPLYLVDEDTLHAKARELHHSAHAKCYVANSVNFPVACEPEIKTA